MKKFCNYSINLSILALALCTVYVTSAFAQPSSLSTAAAVRPLRSAVFEFDLVTCGADRACGSVAITGLGITDARDIKGYTLDVVTGNGESEQIQNGLNSRFPGCQVTMNITASGASASIECIPQLTSAENLANSWNGLLRVLY